MLVFLANLSSRCGVRVAAGNDPGGAHARVVDELAAAPAQLRRLPPIGSFAPLLDLQLEAE